jgi:hypothetical protein
VCACVRGWSLGGGAPSIVDLCHEISDDRHPFQAQDSNSPETDECEAEPQQQPLIGQGNGVVHLAAFASLRGRGLQRDAHGPRILDFDEVGEAADVFDQDGDDADSADEPAEKH